MRTQCWLSSKVFCSLHLRAISKEVLMNLIRNMCSEITLSKLLPDLPGVNDLTHWGRVRHICVGKLSIIDSDNGLSPGRRQAIIWTKAGILLIAPLGTNFSDILIEIYTFSFKKMHLEMSSGKWRPSCLGLNVLKGIVKPFMWWPLFKSVEKTYIIFHIKFHASITLH